MDISLVVSETRDVAEPKVYSTRGSRWLDFDLPDPENLLVWGSSLGYLIQYNKLDGTMVLLDPTCGAFQILPGLGTRLNGINRDNATDWILRAILLEDGDGILNVFLIYHRMTVMDDDGETVIEHARSFCLARVELVDGDREWVDVNHILEDSPFWHDVIFFRKKFYGCTQHGDLFRIRPNGVFHVAVTPLRVNLVLVHRSYLVAVKGVLTLVIRVYEEKLRPDVVLDDDFHEEYTDFYHTTEKVVLYQFRNRAWIKVNDIGTYSLFVGRNTSFCVDCLSYEGLNLSFNRVYFTDEISGGVDLGCFLVGQDRFLKHELPFWSNLPEDLVFRSLPVWTRLRLAAPEVVDTERVVDVDELINVQPGPSSVHNEKSNSADGDQSKDEASASNSNVHEGHSKEVKSVCTLTTSKGVLLGEHSCQTPKFLCSHKMDISLVVSETRNVAEPKVYSTRGSRWLDFDLPDPENLLVWGSSLGYLIQYNKLDGTMVLLDPTSGAFHILPGLGTRLNGINRDNATDWILRAILLEDGDGILNVFLIYHRMAVMDDDGETVIEHARSFCLARVELVDGDREWVDVNHILEDSPFWHDVIFFRKKFYGCTQHGDLFRIRPNGVFHVAVTPLRVNLVLVHRSYLVAVKGVLTLVIRVYEEKLRPDVVLDDDFHEEYTDFYHTTEKVVLYQFRNRAWIKVNDIGTYSLFVGRNTSFCVDCLSYEGLNLSFNRVYFTDEISGGVDLGCFLVGQDRFLKHELPFWSNLPEDLVFRSLPVWTRLRLAAPEVVDTERVVDVDELINVQPGPSSVHNEKSNSADGDQSKDEASASNSNVHVGHSKEVKYVCTLTTSKGVLLGEHSCQTPKFLCSHKFDLSILETHKQLSVMRNRIGATTVDTFFVENLFKDAVDEDVFDIIKSVLYSESVAAGEDAVMNMDLDPLLCRTLALTYGGTENNMLVNCGFKCGSLVISEHEQTRCIVFILFKFAIDSVCQGDLIAKAMVIDQTSEATDLGVGSFRRILEYIMLDRHRKIMKERHNP